MAVRKIFQDFPINDRVIDNIRYVDCTYTVPVEATSTPLTRITNFINNFNTQGHLTVFNAVIYGSGTFLFQGYIYDDKSYGAGLWMSYSGNNNWKRNNYTDTVT
jgi:hypothetical protein